jgi:hypothetical protein
MLSVVGIDQSEEWDNIVKKFKEYDVYYLASYVKAFEIHGDGDPILFYYEGNNMKAINVVIKRDIENDSNFSGKIAKGNFFDLVTPYGYGGFLIEGDKSVINIEDLNEEFNSYCKTNGIVSEFVRFHPILKNHMNLDTIYHISDLGKTVSINLISKAHIWSELTSKNRNMIRKAKKLGVKVFWGRSPELVNEFIGLYNSTMDRDNAKDYYYFQEDFYHSILNDLMYNSLIFYAVNQGKLIAMSIILFGNQQVHYHLSASDKEYQTLAPTNLLLYEVACWGHANGFKTFHLGGGLGSREDSLYKFKKAFNRNYCNDFFVGRKIFDVKTYNELLEIRRIEGEFVGRNTFFPEYRA